MQFRQWVFAKPMVEDVLTLDQFRLEEGTLPSLRDGEALVKVKLINIHAGTRARMANQTTILGQTDKMNYACAEVVQSRDRTFKEGDVIACQSGWQDYQVISSNDEAIGYGPASKLVRALNGTKSQWNYVFRWEMVRHWSPSILMEIFGTSGMTAYFGMRECGPLLPTDAVAVAGATGSVGSIAAQLAVDAGCHVVGFGGGEERCQWLLEATGASGAVNYRAPDLEDRLRAAFPRGIDVYSDGIGGKQTELVLGQMNKKSRLFSFGSAAAFYADSLNEARNRPSSLRRAFGVSEMAETIIRDRDIEVQSWIVHDFYHQRLEAEDHLSRLLQDGKLKTNSNIVEGFDQLPQAVVALYSSARSGKMQVKFE